MNSAVAPLRYGSFRTLWIASVLSAVGTFIQTVTGSWLMLDLTGSNTWVGLMVASSTLPLLFFALAAGALADMFDRTRLMLLAQTIMGGSALGMSVLTYTNAITPGLLLALGLVLGTGVALNLPTWQALLPDLVPRGMIASAVALQSAAFNAARAVGPAIGGAILASLGPAAGFGINSLTYLFVIVALLIVGRNLTLPDRQATSFGTAIGLGVRFARFTPSFRRLLSLVSLFALTSAVIQSVLPNHTRSLGGGEVAYGVLLGAMGVGALLGAWFRERFLARFPLRPQQLTISGFGLAGIGVALAPSVPLATMAMLAAGFFWVLTLTSLNATAQLISPQWIRGRAMSLYSLAFGGIVPLGSILAGVLADATETSTAILVLCSMATLLGILSPRFEVPSINQVRAPEFSPRDAPRHDQAVAGSPVIVLNVWQLSPETLNEFASVMNDVRLIRLSTGAYRWLLMRTSDDPLRMIELFEVGSWEEHLAQHGRIDDASVETLARARAFDITEDGPRTRHLIGIDPEHPGDFERVIREHGDLHRLDGSIPTFDQES